MMAEEIGLEPRREWKWPDRQDLWLGTLVFCVVTLCLGGCVMIVWGLIVGLGIWVILVPLFVAALAGCGWVTAFILENFVEDW